MKLPKRLTKRAQCWVGATYLGKDADHNLYHEAYYCEECRRYSVWPAIDWGESNYFCQECLDRLEIEQGLECDPVFKSEWEAMLLEQS